MADNLNSKTLTASFECASHASQELMELAQDAIIVRDFGGTIRFWNSGAEEIYGWQPAEAVGQVSHSLLQTQFPFSREYLEFLLVQSGRWQGELGHMRRDGERIVVASHMTLRRDTDDNPVEVLEINRPIRERERAEAALQPALEPFRLLIDAVQDYAIFMLDREGRVSSWNPGAQRIKGYKAAEIIGRHFSAFYPRQDIERGKPQWELEVAAREGRFEDEGWRLRKDGSRFWANVIISAVRTPSGDLIGYAKVTRDFTERMRARQDLEASNRQLHAEIRERIAAEVKLQESEESLRQLSRRLLQMQDEERRRIGRDLHDSLGQYLSMLKLNLDTLALLDETNQSARLSEQLAECSSLAGHCITEVRTISYLLHPPMLDEAGLSLVVPWYLEGFTGRSGIQVTSEIPADLSGLSRDLELAIFRVLQESLTNVHRHSGSKTAEVRLWSTEDSMVLEVSDQGKGMPWISTEPWGSEGPAQFGVGLRGMNERVRQLGGQLEISSSPSGTRIRATLPKAGMKRRNSGL